MLGGDVTLGDLGNKVDQFGINKAESKPPDLGLVPGRAGPSPVPGWGATHTA